MGPWPLSLGLKIQVPWYPLGGLGIPWVRLVVTGGADRVGILWSRDGSPQVALEGHCGSIQAVAFSPAGTGHDPWANSFGSH